MAASDGAESTITRLEGARKLALTDPAHYPAIVQGVAPIIGEGAALELRRWGADFLAETFASPAFAQEEKAKLCVSAVSILRGYVEAQDQDNAVIKSSVQAATSIYPLVFRHITYNPTDSTTWQNMAAIKANILRRMDSAVSGVRVCCIKFVQRVVQIQTPGAPPDPRRPDQNEISLALVQRDHPLIPPSTLEAESFGLLDRLLDVFQDTQSDALLVMATLNSVGVLVRSRPSLSSRILNAILSFDPFRLARHGQMDAKTNITITSMERTLRAFLINLNKRSPANANAGRIQGHLDRLAQMHNEAFDTAGRKRGPPVEASDGEEMAKRQRVGAELDLVRPLPPGPVSIAQLFTLTQDETTVGFDVQTIPLNLVNNIVVPLLQSVNPEHLERAVGIVRKRLVDLAGAPSATQIAQAVTATNKNNNVTPHMTAESEQLLNRMEAGPIATDRPPEVPSGPFTVPQPPPMNSAEVNDFGSEMILHLFGMVESAGETPLSKVARQGFNRVAGSSYDRDAWITIAVRLATRTLTGLDSTRIKEETEVAQQAFSLSTEIRNILFQYVLSDFRRRIGVAISWLNEEWYNDRIQQQSDADAPTNYEGLVTRVLDGMLPYLDAKDKILIRFLSEIPAVDAQVLERVKKLAVDPERVSLAVNAIHYLILFRPPVRDLCIDALEDLWRNYDDARVSTAKLLAKWRPHVLEAVATAPAEPNGGGEEVGQQRDSKPDLAPVKAEVAA